MKTILKFPLRIADRQSVEMPEGAMLLGVQMQNGEPCLWAVVDPQAPKANRTIECHGTGNPSIEPDADLEYIGTVQQHLTFGGFVWHFFESRRKGESHD